MIGVREVVGRYSVKTDEGLVIKSGIVRYKKETTFVANCVYKQSSKKELQDIHDYYLQGYLIEYEHMKDRDSFSRVSRHQLQSVVRAKDWLGANHTSEVFTYNTEMMFGYIRSLLYQEISIYYDKTIKELVQFDTKLRYCLEQLDVSNQWVFRRGEGFSLILARR